MEKFVLIDGNSLVNRAFYALPPLINGKGVQTQAVYGFATMLIKAISDIKPDYIAVAFDLPQPTFRHKMYTEYKKNRKKMPDELASQLPILKEMLKIMGIKIIEKAGYEADDIIGTMAKKSCCDTLILTGDRDALQLIDNSNTVLLTKKGLSEVHTVNESELKDKYFLTPSQVIDYKALCGDASDNIPGVAGIGEKTAISLIEKYGSLDGVYSHIDEIQGKLKERLVEGKEIAYLSYKLATIDIQVPIDEKETDCGYKFPFEGKAKLFFQEMGFKSLVKREEIFDLDNQAIIIDKSSKPLCSVKTIDNASGLRQILDVKSGKLAIYLADTLSIAAGSAVENRADISMTFFNQGISYTEAISELKLKLEDENIQKIFFDYKSFKKNPELKNINIKNYIDVKLMQYLVDMSVSCDTVKDLLGSYGIQENEIATGLLYIAGELTIEIEKLKMHELYYDVELPLTDVLYRMEQEGFRVNLSKLNELGQTFVKKQEELAQDIFSYSGQTFNINSPKQLAKVLFEDMQIPYPLKKKSNSTSVDILELLEKEYPIARTVLDYRFYAKLNSTYVEGLRRVAGIDGVIHTDFKQALTTTGRLSSTEPNLQNIPVRQKEGRLLRAAFVAKESNILVSADYSQIELRLMAHFSQDNRMLEAYKNNEDIHASTAAEVFGVDKASVTSDMRRNAKAVNFGIIYGISDYGLATNLNIPVYLAREYINKYFERFSGVKRYLEESVKSAKDSGYAKTLLGRVRRIPELYSSNYSLRQFGERVAMNMPLQGSAADIIKIAMVDVDKALKGLKSKLILQVHDELIIDADESEKELIKEILTDKMMNAVKLSVPLTVELGVGKSWFECK